MHKILCSFILVAAACASRGGDDAGNGSGSGSGSGSNTTTACSVATDCHQANGCEKDVCNNGTCDVESVCQANEACSADDACVPQRQIPLGHGIQCSLSSGTLTLTVAGMLATYGGTASSPKAISIATDADPASWSTSAIGTYRYELNSYETQQGGVSSAQISLPSNQAQRFTLLVWPASGPALRFDLSQWGVTGDGCGVVADGGGQTSTSDGYVIGRAPLCPNKCDDNSSATVDSCQADGCHHDADTGTGGGSGSGGSTGTIVGTIQCQLIHDGSGHLKREVSYIPDASGPGLIAGLEADGSVLPSPESMGVRSNLLGWGASSLNQSWAGSYATYRFNFDPNTQDVMNGFVNDNNDGADSVSGGDYVQLDDWNIVNVTTSYGSSACVRNGGGITVK